MGVCLQKQSAKFPKLKTLEPHIRGRACSNTSMAESVANPQSGKSDPGWYVKLKIQDKDMLTLCIDTVAQVSVMPETIYKLSYGTLSRSDRELDSPKPRKC